MGLIRNTIGMLLAASPVIALADNSTYDHVKECCTNISHRYPDNTFLPDNPAYGDANQRWSETAELQPMCIIRPDSADLVADFLETLYDGTRFGTNGSCPFAIKAGGHNPWAGVNDINTGVVMDLTYLNQTTLSEDRTVVQLGAGGTWGAAYAALEPQGVLFPGARASGVGIGGVVLGGGLSYFTPRVGLAADNVVNFEVVLAPPGPGQRAVVCNANEDNKSDLFRALKGGTSNFGIVTRVDLKAFDNGQIWGGEIVSPINSTDLVLQHFSDFVGKSHEDENAAAQIVFNLNTTSDLQRIISIAADTSGKKDNSLLEPFASLPKLADTSRMTSMANLSEELQSRLPAGQRYLFATVTIVNDLDTIRQVHNISLQTFKTYELVEDVTWNIVYESLPSYYADKGDNVLGLGIENVDRVVMVLNPTWLDPKWDAKMGQAAGTWVQTIQEEMNKVGKASPLELLPYSAPFQDPLGYYGPDNLQFMKDVARKYDPLELFQKLAVGDFRVSQAGNGHSR